jgi:hypothetical protein
MSKIEECLFEVSVSNLKEFDNDIIGYEIDRPNNKIRVYYQPTTENLNRILNIKGISSHIEVNLYQHNYTGENLLLTCKNKGINGGAIWSNNHLSDKTKMCIEWDSTT